MPSNTTNISQSAPSMSHNFINAFIINTLQNKNKKKGKKRAAIKQKIIMHKPPHLYKGETEWYIEYYCFNDNTNTFKRYKYRKGLNSRRVKNNKALRLKTAQIKIAAINQLLLQGFNPENEIDEKVFFGISLAEAIAEAYKVRSSTYSKKRTLQSYSNIINNFLLWIKKNKYSGIRPDDFIVQDAEKFRTYLLTEKKLAHKTVNSIIGVVKSIFSQMEKMEYIERNPFQKLSKLKENQTERNTPFTEQELKTLKQKLPKEHYRLWIFCNFIYYTYLRPNEINHLQYQNIDIQNKQITISGTISKNGKTQVVKIPDFFLEDITKLYNETINKSLYIFSHGQTLENGTTIMARSRVSDLYKKIVKEKYKINKDMYALKHTGAKAFIIGGGNVRELQMQMRHSTLEQTEVYIRSLTGNDLHTINTATKKL